MSPISQMQHNNSELVFNQQKADRKHSAKIAEREEQIARAELRKDEFILSEAAARLSAARLAS